MRRPLQYGAKIVASDGSWNRDCRVMDISDTGAKLAAEQARDLPKEFTLALSEHGNAMRQCEVVWSKDDEIGVRFCRSAE
jgi:PilZ domain